LALLFLVVIFKSQYGVTHGEECTGLMQLMRMFPNDGAAHKRFEGKRFGRMARAVPTAVRSLYKLAMYKLETQDRDALLLLSKLRNRNRRNAARIRKEIQIETLPNVLAHLWRKYYEDCIHLEWQWPQKAPQNNEPKEILKS